MPRLATLVAALLLAVPGAAFAQGAGDDQYQDPFGDEPSQSGSSGGSDSDGGLSEEPPTTGGGSGSGSSGSGSSGGGGTAPSTGTTETPATAAEASGQLPRTGTEPLLLMGLGSAFVLTGVGLRLRTIDPDAF